LELEEAEGRLGLEEEEPEKELERENLGGLGRFMTERSCGLGKMGCLLGTV
jgi:hypothetical protein